MAEAKVGTVTVALVVTVVVLSAAGGAWGQEGRMKCTSQGQCWQCIQTPGCVWCANPKLEMKNCQHFASINLTSFCDPADLQDPVNQVTLVQDDELTVRERKQKAKAQEEIIQLKPQRVKLRLRKGVAQNVTVTFRRALAYPVDLYYLMDLSSSMRDDKQNLARLSKVLADTLEELTDQYTIGFGSFVDKVLLPFTDTTPERLQSPCYGCSSPYSFRNNMKLIKNHEMFKRGVEEAKISGNLDSPEGGFDALMQAMVCKEEIGWRDVARRILVFSTDAKFHSAGDGRLMGVVVPNDEQCHLNEYGEYTDYDKYDYPSVGQINKVAKERNINLIFAVLNSWNAKIYRDLSNEIETSSFGMLEQGSSNVVHLIKEQYESISSEVSLSDNSTEDVSIVYSSACKGGPVLQTNECGGIQENDEVTFTLEITANKCPKNGKGSIVEVKTLEDRVILDLEFHCSCDCPADPDTSKCKDRGQLVCGVCECDEGFYGEECQCGGEGDLISASDDQKKCLANEDDTRPCSGKGTCSCGKCFCRDSSVSGDFCECDTRKCSLGLGVLCSGRGVCDCNKCRCHKGYTGHNCECLDDTACIQPGSNKVCSDHGKCECGKCRCASQENETYTGRYCEDCLQCDAGKCGQFWDCVQCAHFNNSPRKDDCNTCEKYELVKSLDEQVFKEARLCTFKDDEGCYVNFTYRYLETQGRDEVFVQEDRQCPEPPPILAIVFGLIGAIVAVGLLTLIIWKVLTTIHDQREYAKFEKESQNAKFNAEENPLYISAETTVQNPVFAAQQAH